VTLIFEAPVLQNFLKIKLTDHIVSCQHSIHIGLETEVSVYRPLIKFDLNKAIRVGSNDKVDLGPVNHDNRLYVVHNVGQLLLRHTLHTAVHLCGLELSGKNFVFFNPL